MKCEVELNETFREITRVVRSCLSLTYESWNFNSDNYLFTTDTK